MKSHLSPQKIDIDLHSGTRRYGFRGYQWLNTVFGSFDAFDQSGQILDFSDRDLYLPLRESFPSLSFFSLNQVHGNQVHEITTINSVETIFENHGEGDALITSLPYQALTIRTADCIPLFAVSQNKVGIAHAGYKGILSGVLREFKTLLCTEDKDLNLAMGPHIQDCCFQVGEEVYHAFLELELLKDHDIIRRESGTYLSLTKIVENWFLDTKGKTEFIKGLSQCSCCHARYHSYRRDRSENRMGHLIFKTA